MRGDIDESTPLRRRALGAKAHVLVGVIAQGLLFANCKHPFLQFSQSFLTFAYGRANPRM